MDHRMDRTPLVAMLEVAVDTGMQLHSQCEARTHPWPWPHTPGVFGPAGGDEGTRAGLNIRDYDGGTRGSSERGTRLAVTTT